MTSPSVGDCHVGIIYALPLEHAAVLGMFEDKPSRLIKTDTKDTNSYDFGRLHHHSVVVASLPGGQTGTGAAAIVANNLCRTFKEVRSVLLVGIAGGVPHVRGKQIRLGDVVVSQPARGTGGVVQHDYIKIKANGEHEQRGWLNAPPGALLTALSHLQAEHEITDSLMTNYLTEMYERYPKTRTNYTYPGLTQDPLHNNTNDSIVEPVSLVSDVVHPAHPSTEPEIRYGVIASGNQIVTDSSVRNEIHEKHEALCIETEAAGLMNNFPCLVIRGIADYADANKNDVWQKYAAATAAAFAKKLLMYLPTHELSQERTIEQIAGTFPQASSFSGHRHSLP